jgi:C-terminal processing protease CtpA/Prc
MVTSGMVFALDVHLPLNPDGSFTTRHGLEPDIRLPDADPPESTTKEDLLKDECQDQSHWPTAGGTDNPLEPGRPLPMSGVNYEFPLTTIISTVVL